MNIKELFKSGNGKKPIIQILLIVFIIVAIGGIIIDFILKKNGVIAFISVLAVFLLIAGFLIYEVIRRRKSEKSSGLENVETEDTRFLRSGDSDFGGFSSDDYTSDDYSYSQGFNSRRALREDTDAAESDIAETDSLSDYDANTYDTFDDGEGGFEQDNDISSEPEYIPMPQSQSPPRRSFLFGKKSPESAAPAVAQEEPEPDEQPTFDAFAQARARREQYQEPVQPVPTQPQYQEPVQSVPVQPQYQEPVQSVPAQPQYQEPVQSVPAQPQYQEPVQPVPAQPQYQEPVQPVPAQPQYQEPVHSVQPIPAQPQYQQPIQPVPVPVQRNAAEAIPQSAVKTAQPQGEGQSLESFYNDMSEEDILYKDCVEVWAAAAKPCLLRLMKYIEGIDDKRTAGMFGRECEYINAMLDRIFYFTEMDEISQQLEPKKYNFSSLVMECLKRFSPFFTERKLGLLWKGLDVEVFVDRRWFVFALTQVIFNSVEFTPEGGKIAISARKNGEFIDLFVDDSGRGIKNEELPFVFMAGFMSDDAPNQNDTRTGMGLFIARSVVRQMGGEVYAESTPGKGTRIIMHVPAGNSQK